MFFLQPSQKRLLSSLNPLFLVLLVYGVIVVRTTLGGLFPFVRYWDVLLPFVIYFGQRRSLPEGLILTIFTSHLYSLSSTAPIGVFTSYYLALFVIARLLSYAIYANIWFSVLLLVGALSVLSRLVLALVAMAFGHGWGVFARGNFSVFGILWNTVFGFALFWVLEQLDRVTYKVPRINVELAESSL